MKVTKVMKYVSLFCLVFAAVLAKIMVDEVRQDRIEDSIVKLEDRLDREVLVRQSRMDDFNETVRRLEDYVDNGLTKQMTVLRRRIGEVEDYLNVYNPEWGGVTIMTPRLEKGRYGCPPQFRKLEVTEDAEEALERYDGITPSGRWLCVHEKYWQEFGSVKQIDVKVVCNELVSFQEECLERFVE